MSNSLTDLETERLSLEREIQVKRFDMEIPMSEIEELVKKWAGIKKQIESIKEIEQIKVFEKYDSEPGDLLRGYEL